MSPRTKGDGALYKRGDGMWIGRVELPRGEDGKRKFKTVSSKNRNVALQKLKKLRAEVDAQKVVASGSMSVEKWLERWLETRWKSGKLRPGTHAGYERIIRLHINPKIGAKRLDRLVPQDIWDLLDSIESSRNAQLAYILIDRALKDAVKARMLTWNVASVASKPGHVKAEREPLSFKQAQQLLASTAGDPLHSRWMAALFLGARQGELLGLQWDRVDLTTGVVDFSWQLQQLTMVHGCGERNSDKTWPCNRKLAKGCPDRKWDFPRGFEHKPLNNSLVLTRPKTKKGKRIVPLPKPLWKELIKHHETTINDINPHDLVWHNGGKPLDRYKDAKEWHRQLSKAGLPSFPLHSARHSTATILLMAGVPEEIRMNILGHAGTLVTRTYAHVDVSLARAAMDNALKELLPN